MEIDNGPLTIGAFLCTALINKEEVNTISGTVAHLRFVLQDRRTEKKQNRIGHLGNVPDALSMVFLV